MDAQTKIKYLAEKLNLDVPVLKMTEEEGKITLFLYGGAIVEILTTDELDKRTTTEKKSQPGTMSREHQKRKVMDGRD